MPPISSDQLLPTFAFAVALHQILRSLVWPLQAIGPDLVYACPGIQGQQAGWRGLGGLHAARGPVQHPGGARLPYTQGLPQGKSSGYLSRQVALKQFAQGDWLWLEPRLLPVGFQGGVTGTPRPNPPHHYAVCALCAGPRDISGLKDYIEDRVEELLN